jgi:N-formylglutamate deformylase
MDDRSGGSGLNWDMDLPITPTSQSATPPLIIYQPVQQTAPLVFASPHSGRNYLPEFQQSTRLDPSGLRRSEDSFVDELFGLAPMHGAPLIAATFPRAYCDPNREAWELDPTMFDDILPGWVNTTSARVGAGLGTIARIVGSGETIYRGKLSFSDAAARIHSCWEPYHLGLSNLINATRQRFGACLLIDCHSMPGQSGLGRGAEHGPDFVLGDAHGTTCSPRVTRRVEAVLTGFGYQVRRNDPYAGGYVTRHYGRPRERVHALQIEIARGLYMDEARFERAGAFETIRQHLGELAADLAESAVDLLAA